MSVAFVVSLVSCGGLVDEVMKGAGLKTQKGLSTDTIIKGLKEALSVGTDNAVTQVSQLDGYLGNEAIKILIPEKIQKATDMLKKVGFGEQVNAFETSMNRAAEKAAPMATDAFIDSIKKMSFDDAKKILQGGDTAATDFFREKNYKRLFKKFKPSVAGSMNEVGVTRLYSQMMDKYTSLPFVNEVPFDIDEYVTAKSIDGLFHTVAEEEKKIRKDPAARVTDILKEVFAK